MYFINIQGEYLISLTEIGQKYMGQKQGEVWLLTPVDMAQGNLKKQVANVIFPILTSYSDLENCLSLFVDAWLGGAADQLMGQIASAKIPLSRMISPQLYWVMSGDEFTLEINNPGDLKILVVGNNPNYKNI